MDFCTNKKSIEVIKKGVFRGTYFILETFILVLMVSRIEIPWFSLKN